MTRRAFMTLLGGAAIASWRTAFAQRPDGMPRVGALFSQAEGDPEGQARVAAFEQCLQELGWTAGQKVQIEYRWAGAVSNACNRMQPSSWH